MGIRSTKSCACGIGERCQWLALAEKACGWKSDSVVEAFVPNAGSSYKGVRRIDRRLHPGAGAWHKHRYDKKGHLTISPKRQFSHGALDIFHFCSHVPLGRFKKKDQGSFPI